MRDGYSVSASVLVEQARRVGELAAELQAAADAAGSIALTPTAFGDAAGAAVPALDRLGSDVLDAVVAALNTLTETGSRLRATAQEYEQRETDAVTSFGALGEPDSSGLSA
ncbi:hypothetical protein ACFWNN_26240 [Lentzea sp. NPDC058450]|uniref:hypothetical protein n=1 Tax=Lentzea sp. NPDC058450 TaxID=3346505 RepID=UPI00364C3989